MIATEETRAVAWRDATPALGRVVWPRQVVSVIRTRSKLVELLDVATLGRAPRAPAIDFRRRTALLFAVGPRSSTGYELRVVGITERSGSILAEFCERRPRLGERDALRLTFPYRLITIPATGKPVRFKNKGC